MEESVQLSADHANPSDPQCSNFPADPPASDKLCSGMNRISLRTGLPPKQSSERRIRDSMRNSIQFVRPLNDGVKKIFRRDSLLAAPMRIFYESVEARDEAADMMMDVSELMAYLTGDAKTILTSDISTAEQQEEVMEYLLWDGIDLSVNKVDGKGCYGIEVVEGLFWEAYVMTQDSGSSLFSAGDSTEDDDPDSKVPASKRVSDVSTESDVQFQNFKMLRTTNTEEKAVVWQMDRKSPMRPGEFIFLLAVGHCRSQPFPTLYSSLLTTFIFSRSTFTRRNTGSSHRKGWSDNALRCKVFQTKTIKGRR